MRRIRLRLLTVLIIPMTLHATSNSNSTSHDDNSTVNGNRFLARGVARETSGSGLLPDQAPQEVGLTSGFRV